MGSSPLARGPRTRNLNIHLVVGLIPARAGTTVNTFPMEPVFWAHPRSRGDHDRKTFRIPVMMGSSPLARGPLR